jgi:hypothetical protein
LTTTIEAAIVSPVEETRGLVIFGDIVGSRRDSVGATAWLRALVDELNRTYASSSLADFAFTQGDELQGLLPLGADPFDAVLRASLSETARKMRWVCILGGVDPGEGPATQRTGTAFLGARRAIEAARAGHDRLLVVTGQAESDALLNGMTPALMDMLDDLTPTQRVVARMALIDGLRQSEVAERLGKRRATVSVSFGRSKVVPLEHLVDALRKVYAQAVALAAEGGNGS